MDRLILESHFLLAGRSTMMSGGAALLAADANLFESAHVPALKKLLLDRGLSRDLTPEPQMHTLVRSEAVDVQNPREGASYASMLDDTQTIVRPGALALRVHFSRIETEVGRDCPVAGACDNVYMFDGAGNLYQVLHGSRTDVDSAVIAGDTVKVRLVTDPALVKFGYSIDRVDEMGPSRCGDGARATNEACDGADFGAATCTTLGYRTGALACREDCTVDASACIGSATCGNGKIDGPEECDGEDIAGWTCARRGFRIGTLRCSAECRFDTSECSTCGNGTREGYEDCDADDLGGKDCAAAGFGGGRLACSDACTFDASACLPPVCR